MAAILPPINGQRGHVVGQATAPDYVKPKTNTKIQKNLFKLAPVKKHKGKADRDLMEKRERLRALQPTLTKQNTAEFRNTFIHNLSLDMLAAGYHLSFKELFFLINRQEADRQRAGPESLMWNQTMISEEEEKLNILQKHLTLAEIAQRKGDFLEVYNCQFKLASHFEETGDKWLSDHFYESCLQTSHKVQSDGGRLQAEGQCNMGSALEKGGKNFEAAEHYELYYTLSSEHSDWIKEDITFCTDACIHLCRINSVIGQQLQETDPEKSLDFLLKAFNKSKESCDRQLEGEAAYQLGLAYERIGDGETALFHLNHYLETCKCSQDTEGVGRACDAIAKAYSRKGQVEESISYLKQFVEMAEKSGKDSDLSKACHNLGNLYNKLGQYEDASEYFSKAYNISRSLGETKSIHVNRVQYGIALAHRMMTGLGSHIVLSNQPCLDRLIEWKSARTDDFEKPFPEPKIEEDTPQNKMAETASEKPVEPLERENTDDSMSSQEDTTEVNFIADRELTADTTITMATETTQSSIGD